MSVTYENTYWNHKGKHEAEGKKLDHLIPASGEVPTATIHPALETYRIARNCYYDLYNNGLMNRGQEFTETFGISADEWPGWSSKDDEDMQDFCDRTETRMDEIILAAYAEQFPAQENAASPIPEKTFDRFLRFRHLSQPLTPNGTFRVRDQGIITTYIEEDHQETFSKAFFPLEGDLLEIEYPASYGYFLFGKDGSGEWKYTTKTA